MNLQTDKQYYDLLKNSKIKTPSITINQTSGYLLNKKEGYHEIASFNEKGLSKSRNTALSISKADIVLLADDDIIYEDDYKEIILDGYKKYPKADIIIFDVDIINPKRQVKKIKEGKISYLGALKIFSPQITFKRKNISIKFDENFGAGSKYDRGEDNIFLFDALNNNKKIYHYSKKIATVRQEKSTWYKEKYDKEFMIKQAICYYRLTPKMYWLLILIFYFKKKDRCEEKNIFKIMKEMFVEIKNYKTYIEKRG